MSLNIYPNPSFHTQKQVSVCRLVYVLVISLLLLSIGDISFADIPKPDPPPGVTGTNIWEILVGWAKLALEALLLLLAVVAFALVGYAGLIGFFRLFTGREEWGVLISVFVVGIVVIYFVGQMAYEGSELLKQLTT